MCTIASPRPSEGGASGILVVTASTPRYIDWRMMNQASLTPSFPGSVLSSPPPLPPGGYIQLKGLSTDYTRRNCRGSDGSVRSDPSHAGDRIWLWVRMKARRLKL